MTPSEAWKIVLPDLAAATVEIWTDENYDDEPEFRQTAADIEAGNITPGVLDELENKINFDSWRADRKLYNASLIILAVNGRLEEYDEEGWKSGRIRATRKPKVREILGKKYIIG